MQDGDEQRNCWCVDKIGQGAESIHVSKIGANIPQGSWFVSNMYMRRFVYAGQNSKLASKEYT